MSEKEFSVKVESVKIVSASKERDWDSSTHYMHQGITGCERARPAEGLSYVVS